MSIFKRNQAKQAFQRHPICLIDLDNDYILEEIEYWDKIGYKQNIRDDGNE